MNWHNSLVISLLTWVSINPCLISLFLYKDQQGKKLKQPFRDVLTSNTTLWAFIFVDDLSLKLEEEHNSTIFGVHSTVAQNCPIILGVERLQLQLFPAFLFKLAVLFITLYRQSYVYLPPPYTSKVIIRIFKTHVLHYLYNSKLLILTWHFIPCSL